MKILIALMLLVIIGLIVALKSKSKKQSLNRTSNSCVATDTSTIKKLQSLGFSNREINQVSNHLSSHGNKAYSPYEFVQMAAQLLTEKSNKNE